MSRRKVSTEEILDHYTDFYKYDKPDLNTRAGRRGARGQVDAIIEELSRAHPERKFKSSRRYVKELRKIYNEQLSGNPQLEANTLLDQYNGNTRNPQYIKDLWNARNQRNLTLDEINVLQEAMNNGTLDYLNNTQPSLYSENTNVTLPKWEGMPDESKLQYIRKLNLPVRTESTSAKKQLKRTRINANRGEDIEANRLPEVQVSLRDKISDLTDVNAFRPFFKTRNQLDNNTLRALAKRALLDRQANKQYSPQNIDDARLQQLANDPSVQLTNVTDEELVDLQSSRRNLEIIQAALLSMLNKRKAEEFSKKRQSML